MSAKKIIQLYPKEKQKVVLYDTTDLATKSDIKRLEELFRGQKTKEDYILYKENIKEGKILTPSDSTLNLSVHQRVLILLVSGILSGIFLSFALINIEESTLLLFYLALTFSSFGTTISSFWALMKGKKYDTKLDK